jgi:hypothetical protein
MVGSMKVGMEPVVCAYLFTSFMRYTLVQSLVLDKLCTASFSSGVCVWPHIRPRTVEYCSNHTTKSGDADLKTQAYRFNIVSSFVLLLPTLITSVFLGACRRHARARMHPMAAVSDRHDRRLVIVIPLTGLVFASLNDILQATLMHNSVLWLLLSGERVHSWSSSAFLLQTCSRDARAAFHLYSHCVLLTQAHCRRQDARAANASPSWRVQWVWAARSDTRSSAHVCGTSYGCVVDARTYRRLSYAGCFTVLLAVHAACILFVISAARWQHVLKPPSSVTAINTASFNWRHKISTHLCGAVQVSHTRRVVLS